MTRATRAPARAAFLGARAAMVPTRRPKLSKLQREKVLAPLRLALGDEVRVPPVRVADEPSAESASAGQLAQVAAWVIHEDRDFLVINKPSGLASHGGSGIRFGAIDRCLQRFLVKNGFRHKDRSGDQKTTRKDVEIPRLSLDISRGFWGKLLISPQGQFNIALERLRLDRASSAPSNGQRSLGPVPTQS